MMNDNIQLYQCFHIIEERQVRFGTKYCGCIQSEIHEEGIVLSWDMFHIIEHGYPYLILMLCVILDMSLVFMISTNLVKFHIHLGTTMAKIAIVRNCKRFLMQETKDELETICNARFVY